MCKKLIYLLSLVFVLSMVLTGPASAADPNLVLWLEFEGDANDSSNYGRDVLVTGTLDYDTGVIGQAADFGGSGNYVTTPGYTGILGRNAFSITAWCLPDSGNDGDIVGWGTSGTNNYYVRFRSNSDHLQVDTGSAGAGNLQGGTDPWNTDGEWHHVALTVMKNSPGVTHPAMKLYLDGIDDTDLNTSNGTRVLNIPAGGSDVTIGIRYDTQENALNSWFDDVRIYDKELTWDEIRILAGLLAPILLEPADEDILAEATRWLKWTPGVYPANVNGHEVYLGDNYEDVNTGTGTLLGKTSSSPYEYQASGLDTGTVYYWKVDAVNESHPDERWSSEIWSFLVPPREAYNPDPCDGAKFVATNPQLSWSPGLGSQGNVVYFGTNFADVNNATGNESRSATTYDPETLAYDANYYWRIDTIDADFNEVKGLVWSFTTVPNIPVTDPNLMGWWTFDEGEGTTAWDWSGHGNDGTLMGDPQWAAGKIGGALDLDGNPDYVDITGYYGVTRIAADNQHAFSITAWIKTTDGSGEIAGWGTNSNGQRVEFRINNNRLRCEQGDDNVQGDTNVNDDEWHHVAVTVKAGATISYPDVKLYLDSIDDTRPSTDPNKFNIVADHTVKIGRQYRTSGRWLDGLVDDVRIYNKELSWGEVVQLMYPGMAYNPSPIDRAPDVPTDAKLTWSPATDEFTGSEYTKHDLYFGTNFEDVNEGKVTPIRIDGGPNEYTPPKLDYYNYYYWRVDEVNGSEEAVRGFVWSFKATYDPNQVLDPNLLGYWKLDDVDSGVMAVDDSGYGHLGTLYGGAGYVPGHTDQAVQFDGIDDYVSIDQGGQVEGYKGVLGPNAFSVAAWIKTVDPAVNNNNQSNIVCWGTDSGGERVEFRIQSSRLWVSHGSGSVQGDTTVNDAEWHHVVTTVIDNAELSSSDVRVYVDGFDDTRYSSDPDTFDIVADADLGIGYRATHGDRFFEGLIDEVRLYDYVLSPGEVVQLMYPGMAYNPSPMDGARDVPTDANLIWTPATDEFTDKLYTKHDLYFSTNFEDVNEGKVTPIRIDGGPNEHAPTLDYINYVIGDGWYYWRVDEVNDSEEAIRGFVWRFSTTFDPNQVVDPNLLAWYKFDGDATDSSGRCLHLTEHGEPAYTAGFEDQAINLDAIDDYAVYEFPTEEKFDYTVTAWVRANTLGQPNYHSVFSSHRPNTAGFQLDVDGTNPGSYRYHDGFDKLFGTVTTGWVHLAVTCDGTRTSLYYNGSLVPDIETTPNLVFNQYAVGINRRYEIASVFDGAVDEVRIYDYELLGEEIVAVMRIDLARAWMPNPGDGQTGVAREPTLSWNPGDYAPGTNGHIVYFGADDPCNMVLVSTPTQPQTPNNFDPGALDLGRTYYWAVDEVNVTTPGVDPGKIWSFTVTEFLVVDDMESYTRLPDENNNIFYVWIDDFGRNAPYGDGSVVSVEDTIAADGNSMRFDFNDTVAGLGYLSMAKAEVANLPIYGQIGNDWTSGGAEALSLQFYGDPNNGLEPMWVKLGDTDGNSTTVTYGDYLDEDTNDVNEASWEEWNIALSDFTGVDVTSVNDITIGFGDGTLGGGVPAPNFPDPNYDPYTAYFDDIRLYVPRCLPLRAKPRADFSSDCVVGYPDLEILTDDWLISGYEFDVAASVSSANLEVHYEFENNLNDSSVNARHADPCGTISYAAGIVGANAVDLDVNDYAVADYNGVTGPNSRTCCAWIKTTDVDGGDFISWGTNSAGQKWILRIEPDDGYLRAEFGGSRYIVGSTDLRDGQWYHVAIVLDSDGTPEVQDLELYVDGMRELLSDVANGAIDTADGANLHIGRSPWNPLRPFEGQIDDLQIYSRALGHDEVAKLAGLTGTIEQPLLPLLTTPEDTDLFDDEIINFKDYARLLDEWLDEELWP